MAQFWEYMKSALRSIQNNRKRAILTMLGIIMGISSVIMIFAVGNAVKVEINDQVHHIGDGEINIMLNDELDDNDVIFTEEDCDLIESRVGHIKGVTRMYSVLGTAEGRKGSKDITIRVGNENLIYYSPEPIVRGKYFTESDCLLGNRVCVLDESSARLLFGTTNVVGMSFDLTIGMITQEVTIVGIRQDSRMSGLLASLSGEGAQTEIPYTLLENVYGISTKESDRLYIFPVSREYSGQVLTESKILMENAHHVHGEDKIKAEDMAKHQIGFSTIMDVVMVFVSFVAAISLLVGGVGVMNIMLVSVTERTREIGIRKSLGARTSAIMLQFLAESGIITLVGGIIGILLGNFLAIVICALIKFPPQLSLSTSLFAAAFSMAVGIFFGMYPAKRAAKMNPIEALRHE